MNAIELSVRHTSQVRGVLVASIVLLAIAASRSLGASKDGDDVAIEIRDRLSFRLYGDLARTDKDLLLVPCGRSLDVTDDTAVAIGGSYSDLAGVVPQKHVYFMSSGVSVEGAFLNLLTYSISVGKPVETPDSARRREAARKLLFEPDARPDSGYSPILLKPAVADWLWRQEKSLNLFVDDSSRLSSVGELLFDSISMLEAEHEYAEAMDELRRSSEDGSRYRVRAWAARVLQGASLGGVTYLPAPSTWLATSGWGRVTFTLSSGVEMSMLVKRVAIQRPWLDMSLFNDQYWVAEDSEERRIVVSYGTKAAVIDPEVARIPLIPSEFILAKEIQSSGGVETNSLPSVVRPSTPDALIVAVGCSVVPRSPNPRPGLIYSTVIVGRE